MNILNYMTQFSNEKSFKDFFYHTPLNKVLICKKSSAKTTNKSLKWEHIAISNAKRALLGIYHKISDKYLQNYLNEFIYKLNRRHYSYSLFERLLIAVD